MVDRVGTVPADVVKVDASGRRWYTARFKRAVVGQCQQPGMSVSKVAISYGLNTNLVRKWVQRAFDVAAELESVSIPTMLPVTVRELPKVEPRASMPVETTSARDIDDAQCAIEVRIGETLVLVNAVARSDQIEAVLRSLR